MQLLLVKMKLLEGQQLTQAEERLLIEAAPVFLLVSLLDNIPAVNEAKNWVQSKLGELAKNILPKEVLDTWHSIDKAVADSLGSEDASVGSMLTMLFWNLVSNKGQPLPAVISMIKGVGREVALAHAGKFTGVTQENLINDALQIAASNEPWADRVEQQLAKMEQRFGSAPTPQLAQIPQQPAT